MPPTVAFIPSSLRTHLAAKRVTAINVAAHPPHSAIAAGKTNHWILHLICSDDSSVNFDMSPTGNGPGMLIVSTVDHSLYANYVKVYDVSVTAGMTLQSVLDVITERGYERYNFTESGQGCRHWVKRVLKLLKEINVVGEGIEDAMTGLETVWMKGGNPVPRAEQTGIVQGDFF